MPVVLKISSQRQLTLTRAIVEAMGTPSHVEATLVNGDLVLRPAAKLTLAQAERAYRTHGITADVLAEALRIVAAREGAG
jgi:hypothetical protein